MTSRETVKKSLYFQTPERYAHDFPEPYGTDFYSTGLSPSPDDRPSKGIDAWGCVWECLGKTALGEVKDSPLKDWKDFDKLQKPDIGNEAAWEYVKSAKAAAGDKYIIGYLVSIYERVHFIRGLENTWCDIIEDKDNLLTLIDLIVEMNVKIIKRYVGYGVDGIMMTDDWGLQDRLMINPAHWREIWKPAYKLIFDAAHQAGLDVWLHSCGYIVDILGDLIDIGLNAVHMDQQENMGLERLKDFRGRLAFFSPVDIQHTMVTGSPEEIRGYCRKMAACLGTREGGFIPRWYTDPAGAGHTRENIDVMCREFLKISDELYARTR